LHFGDFFKLGQLLQQLAVAQSFTRLDIPGEIEAVFATESIVPPVRMSAIFGKLAMDKSFLTSDCD